MKSQFVSCIITVNQNCEYLGDAIQSLLNQTHKNFEVIIINDGNHKGVKSIVSQFPDLRIKNYNFTKIGRGKALNKGIELSKGDLIAILDADDLSHNDRLKIQINLIKTSYDLVCSNFTIHLNNFKKIKGGLKNAKIYYHELIKRNPICHSSVMFRKKILNSQNRYSEIRNNLFDYDLWIRLAEKNCKFGIIKYPLVFKRIHNNQFFEKKRRLHYIFSTLSLKLIAFRKFRRNNLEIFHVILSTFYTLLPRGIRILFMGKE